MERSGTCDSCGVRDEPLAPVHRKYLASPAGNAPDRVLDEVEQWCIACLTSYPHEPAD